METNFPLYRSIAEQLGETVFANLPQTEQKTQKTARLLLKTLNTQQTQRISHALHWGHIHRFLFLHLRTLYLLLPLSVTHIDKIGVGILLAWQQIQREKLAETLIKVNPHLDPNWVKQVAYRKYRDFTNPHNDCQRLLAQEFCSTKEREPLRCRQLHKIVQEEKQEGCSAEELLINAYLTHAKEDLLQKDHPNALLKQSIQDLSCKETELCNDRHMFFSDAAKRMQMIRNCLTTQIKASLTKEEEKQNPSPKKKEKKGFYEEHNPFRSPKIDAKKEQSNPKKKLKKKHSAVRISSEEIQDFFNKETETSKRQHASEGNKNCKRLRILQAFSLLPSLFAEEKNLNNSQKKKSSSVNKHNYTEVTSKIGFGQRESSRS